MDALWTLLGRLHPMTVHFPIALWVLLAGVALHPRWRDRPEVVRSLAWLAVLSTGIAVLTGFIYLDQQSFQGAGAELIGRHRLLGIAAAALSVGALVAVSRLAQSTVPLPVRGLLLLTAIGVGATAHLGGMSVHGEDFFSRSSSAEEAPAAASDAPPTDGAPAAPAADVAPDFAAEVWPILKKSCVRCHGHRKQKGDLRLDSLAAAQAGGKSGKPALVPGDPAASELHVRITLPQEDEDYMPSKGDPLTPAQVDTLKRWIAAGAAWPGG